VTKKSPVISNTVYFQNKSPAELFN